MDPEPAEPEATADLLRRAAAGEPEAFERLFAAHRPYLLKVVGLRLDPRLRRRVDASDVVQEAQLEAFRRLADYLARRPMAFRLWLRQTACERLLMLQPPWNRIPGLQRAVNHSPYLYEQHFCYLLRASGLYLELEVVK